ncbi:MAG: serine/threonine-protein kinase [Ferruginibacter sp.]
MGSGDAQITEVAGYRLAGHIGSGGMGNVYKAFNASLNRFAAVKILHQDAFAERFKNEAYIQSTISHPNIARLYEYVKCGNKHCIVMEYVDGESLDAVLHKKGRLSSEETENILRQIISALTYLHKKDIMHRDIKPQNFKLQPDGTVKMLDFGIAKHKYSPKLTQLGFVVGTMEYLAPEQFEQKEELKSDIWCLAVMTYELLTGYMPFESSNPLTLRSKITKGSFTNPKILVPGISNKLSIIIDKSFKVNPANRISAVDIEKILGRKKQTTNINNKVEPYRFQMPSKKMLAYGGGAIAALLLIFFIANRQPDIKPPPPPPVPGNNLSLTIDVPGVQNVELITNDNLRMPVPYTITGMDGDKLEFTLHAEGYKDKKVEVMLTTKRSSFMFNLEKINN